MKFQKKNLKGQSMKSEISPVSLFNKKAQMQISFGVIFAIILIVVFIAFTIYGIGKFLGIQRFAQVETFKADFQNDIDDMWISTSGSQEVGPYYLPKSIKQVCFKNNQDENMYFVPDNFNGALLKNINIAKTLNRQSKLCIDTSNGKISMTIKKDYDEYLVTIAKN